MKRMKKQQEAGFTLMEMIVVVILVAILAAIAAPSFITMLNRQRLGDAQAEAMSAIREAQAKARQQKRNWQACFQDDGTQVRWFVSPGSANTCAINPGSWNSLIGTDSKIIQIDSAYSNINGGFYSVAFLPNGWVDLTTPPDDSTDVNKITFKLRNQDGGSKRCVYVATLLGAVRTASNDDCKK